jgi:ribosomal protein S18 acetylase RimI-like enzyme
MDEKHFLVERIPTLEEYRKLREAIEWGNASAAATEAGLNNSLFSVCALFNGEVVGCGRVIGDGGIYFYIQDVIVMPAFQGQGIGTDIMNALMGHLRASAHAGAFVGLIAAREKAAFYKRFGFQERPSDAPGMYLIIDEQYQ